MQLEEEEVKPTVGLPRPRSLAARVSLIFIGFQGWTGILMTPIQCRFIQVFHQTFIRYKFRSTTKEPTQEVVSIRGGSSPIPNHTSYISIFQRY